MKNVIINILVLLCMHCTINVEDLKNGSLEYKPPPYKYLLGVTTKGFYAASKDDPETWERVGGQEIDLDYSTPDRKQIENLMTSHYCNGIWLVVGQSVRVNMTTNELGDQGSGVKNGLKIYWTDRQSPYTQWNEYEIHQSTENLYTERLIPLDITCNERSGKWTIAGFHYMLESHNPTSSEDWKITHVNKIAPSGGLVFKRVKSFENFTYGIFFDWVGDVGYLGLQVEGEPWEFVHANNDLGADPHLWHTVLFDPTQNKIVIGATGPYVVYCEVSTLECDIIPTATSVDSLATNYEGYFFGVSVTNNAIVKLPEVQEWDTKPEGGRAWRLPPRLASNNVVYLAGTWFIAGHFGQLAYHPNKVLPRLAGWINVHTGDPYREGGGFQDQYNNLVTDGGAPFGSRQFTSLILGGL